MDIKWSTWIIFQANCVGILDMVIHREWYHLKSFNIEKSIILIHKGPMIVIDLDY